MAASMLQKLDVQTISLAELVFTTYASRECPQALSSSETEAQDLRRSEAVQKIQQF